MTLRRRPHPARRARRVAGITGVASYVGLTVLIGASERTVSDTTETSAPPTDTTEPAGAERIVPTTTPATILGVTRQPIETPTTIPRPSPPYVLPTTTTEAPRPRSTPTAPRPAPTTPPTTATSPSATSPSTTTSPPTSTAAPTTTTTTPPPTTQYPTTTTILLGGS